MNSYYKLLLIQVDSFESTIIDERHFHTKEDATEYAEKRKDAGCVSLILEL